MSEGILSSPELVIQFPKITVEIEAMIKIDQDMREKNLLEHGTWDDTVDAKNTERMKEIVAEIGWPTVSKVGEDVSHKAWLLIQHADRDVEFQKTCLTLMKQEPNGELNLTDIAMLEDRVRVNSGQQQLYGTQFQQIDGEYKPRPIENEANVNERRKQMNLDTLEANIAEMYKKYGPPDQG